jgi:protein TonB
VQFHQVCITFYGDFRLLFEELMPRKFFGTNNEKTFYFLLALSLLLHVLLYVVMDRLPHDHPVDKTAPIMVDLPDLPQIKRQPAREKSVPVPDLRERKRDVQEVPRQEARKGEGAVLVPPLAPVPPVTQGDQAAREKQVRQSPYRAKERSMPPLSQLFPGADSLSRLENAYRNKYSSEIEEGDSTFLNTEDVQLGSFLRRFENAVYGVWRYPRDAVSLGLQGVTPVRITFNRKGEIEKIVLLESSGSKILDEEVMRTLRAIGPLGAFPKSYSKDSFNLIAFFHYRFGGGSGSSILR